MNLKIKSNLCENSNSGLSIFIYSNALVSVSSENTGGLLVDYSAFPIGEKRIFGAIQ